jgi:hypothetical protein
MAEITTPPTGGHVPPIFTVSGTYEKTASDLHALLTPRI